MYTFTVSIQQTWSLVITPPCSRVDRDYFVENTSQPPPQALGMHNDRNRLLERLNYPNVRRWSAVKLAGVGARSYLEKLQFLRPYKGGKHRFLSSRLVQRVMVQTQVALEAFYRKHKA
jgi:hypothetical protein